MSGNFGFASEMFGLHLMSVASVYGEVVSVGLIRAGLRLAERAGLLLASGTVASVYGEVALVRV